MKLVSHREVSGPQNVGDSHHSPHTMNGLFRRSFLFQIFHTLTKHKLFAIIKTTAVPYGAKFYYLTTVMLLTPN